MNFKHYEYVSAVVREGSITAASKKLYISQPALSQAIKQLEQDLGVPVFDRSTDPLSLTFAGEKYMSAAKHMLDIETDLRAEIAESKKQVHGRLRLGIPNQRGAVLLPLVLPEFIERYPFVKIELFEHGSATTERMVAEGDCDLALITTSPKPNNLNYVLIENEQVVLMAARSTELAQRFEPGRSISISEAKNEKFVSMQPGHSVRIIQDRLFELHHISPRILLETNNMEAAKYITVHCNAMMLYPYVYFKNSHDLQYRVQCHPLLNNDMERHFYLAFRKDMHLTQYMRDFVRLCCEKLNVPYTLPEDE
ncbi:MAG: LysR family transcriptional regulator [Clostridia bacterium]|nr:LysR family transcriptional regulator [Clostridia bacterium]